MDKQDMLLEIGTEEIPADFIMPALGQMQDFMKKGMADARLDHGEMKFYATPRRLAILIKDVASKQKTEIKEIRGPAGDVAFQEDGKPTRAAQGFAKSKGVAVDDLVLKEVNGRQYVFVQIEEKGRPARDCLSEILPLMIKELSFPKTMRWGDGNFRFVRPIHWLVALLGSQEINFAMAGIESGRITRGHRFVKGQIEIAEPGEYLKKLRDGYVIADHEERKIIIREHIEKVAADRGGEPVYDDALLEEVTFLVEYPVTLCGAFAEKYLQLPPEVLITTMQKHQRYFPVRSRGKDPLLPIFISIRSGPFGDDDLIIAGNQKVLKARLEDALFFYNEDSSRSLFEHARKLKGVTFIEGLGNMAAKTRRLVFMVEKTGMALDWDKQKQEIALKSAELSKADLVTLMVHEFPDLQGIMGHRYALQEGLAQEIGLAIEEHYKPRFADDELPSTPWGQVISLADKLDNLVAAFYSGNRPSGSQDPLALRRQGLAIVKILASLEKDLDLQQLLDYVYRAYKEQGYDLESIAYEVTEFLKGRIERYMEEKGFRYDTANSLLDGRYYLLKEGLAKCQALERIRGDETFKKLIEAYIRTANILRSTEDTDTLTVEKNLLQHDIEEELYESCTSLQEKGDEMEKEGEYLKLFQLLSELAEPLDRFFEEVMVMVEDRELRSNRLALLQMVKKTLDRGVDFSRMVLE